MEPLPLMKNLPRGELPTGEPLILASGSPRRAELLQAAGYRFEVRPASDAAECGICSRETAPQMVARLALRKAADVAGQLTEGGQLSEGFLVAADTLASCCGQILGKPKDREHAEAMLRLLSGRDHDVYTGVCLWSIQQSRCAVDVVRTRLKMDVLSEENLKDHLDSLRWDGKAGAFGYQDGNDWLKVVGEDSESNVVGLPMERLAEMMAIFDSLAEKVDIEA